MICGDVDRVAAYVAEKTRTSHWGPFSAIGVEQDGQIVGGAVINNYVKGARCTLHAAGEGNWCSRELLFLVFDYIFNKLECKVVVNYVESWNEASLRFTKHVGFKELFTIPEAGRNCDLVILSYCKADCKWIHNAKFIRKYHAL